MVSAEKYLKPKIKDYTPFVPVIDKYGIHFLELPCFQNKKNACNCLGEVGGAS